MKSTPGRALFPRSSESASRTATRAFSSTLVGAVLLASMTPGSLIAATWTVTTTADTVDGSCDPFHCSLRDAVRAASFNPGADTVVLPAGTYRLTIAGGDEDLGLTGDLDMTGDLTIDGAGAASTVIDGNGLDRVLHITDLLGPSATVIQDVTIRGGRATVTESEGGGIFFAGAGAGSSLTIDRCVITGNSGTSADGGGILIGAATVVIRDSTISNNSAGGADSQGGGLAVSTGGTARIERSTINGNQAGAGGGIVVLGASLEVINSTVSGNQAFDEGGGLANLGGSVNVAHTTFAGNQAASGEGTALYHDGLETTLANNVVSGDCAGNGTYQSSGGNLESPGNTCGLNQPADSSSVTATSLALGPLAANGGPTATHELMSGSAAIDAALLGACPSVDQRGEGRARSPSDPCDAGSFERSGGGAPSGCVEDATHLCLNQNRFRLEGKFRTPQGQTGSGRVQQLTNDTGYFWFFNEDNVEVVVKVLNACSFGNRFWVFAGGLTNVEVDLTIEDTQSQQTKSYHNPLGQQFQPIQDTDAFATCP